MILSLSLSKASRKLREWHQEPSGRTDMWVGGTSRSSRENHNDESSTCFCCPCLLVTDSFTRRVHPLAHQRKA